MMGGGNFVVPVQTVTDFLENKLSGKIIHHYSLFIAPGSQLIDELSLIVCASNICTPVKLSVGCEGSKSPSAISHAYN